MHSRTSNQRDIFPWILGIIYALVFTVLGAVRYADHRNFVDFGIFEQTTASAFGCFCNAIEGSHWAFHFSPILYVVGAAVALVHSPLTLIALQAIGGALVIPPIYGLVVRRGDRSIARATAIVVALYPALAGLTFGDFHENGFAPAAIAWMLWGFDGGVNAVTIIGAIAALAVKEDQAIFVGITGLFGAFRFRGTTPGRISLFIAISSALVFAYFFWHIQPHAAANPQWAPTRFYSWDAKDVRLLFPHGIFQRVGFIVLAFLPLLFLPFRSRMMWLAATPLAEVLLSRMSTTFTMGTHYAGAWIGFVLVAFAFAVRRIPMQRARSLLLWSMALCVVELAVANPMHPGLNLHPILARDRALTRVLRALPLGISIATQEEAYTHLALIDPNATLLPDQARTPVTACFILVDRAYPRSPRLIEYGAGLNALIARRAFVLVRREAGIELYRSVAACNSPSALHA